MTQPNKYRTLGEEINNARSEENLTQRELSRLTGISQSKISQFEVGMLVPSKSELDALSKVLNMRLNPVWHEARIQSDPTSNLLNNYPEISKLIQRVLLASSHPEIPHFRHLPRLRSSRTS